MAKNDIKILAIDDNPDNLTALKAVLSDTFPGATVFMALNGAEGLELALAKDPDVILLDMVMSGMDGFEICRKLKEDENLLDIPVIFLTHQKTDRESRTRALEAGAEAFLSKPIDAVELTAQIRAMAKIKAANRFHRMEKEQLAELVDERTLDLEAELAERKRAEDKIKQAQALTNIIIDSIPGTFYMLDENGQYVRWNAYQRDEIVGKPEDQVAGTNAIDTIHPDDRALIQTRIANVLENGVAETVEGRVLLRGGPAFRWLLMTGSRMVIDGRPFLVGIGIDITERKQAEEALKESDQRHRDYIANTPYGVFVADNTGKYIQVNPSACRITGYQEHELLSMNISDLHLEESREQAARHFQAVVREGKATGELMFHTKSGERRWWFVSAVKISDTRFLGFCNDNTESKQAEIALQIREQTLQKIFDILPVGLWFADKNGKLLRGNPMGVKIWGAEPNVSIPEYGVFKARRLPSGEEIAPDDWALAHSIREGVTVSDELLEIDAFDGQKKIILNYTAPIHDAQGDIQGAIVVNQDITERKQAEDALRESEEKYRLIAENMSDVISVMDMNLKFTYVSPSIQRLTGYTVEEAIKHSVEEIMTPESFKRIQKIFEEEILLEASGAADPNRTHIIVEFEQNKQNLSIVWVEASCTFIRDKDQHPTGILVVSRDITERKRAEAERERLSDQLQQAQKLESVGRLAGGVAHDFNNMLGIILGHTEMVMDQVSPNQPMHEDLMEIRKAAIRSADLTRQLLAFARKQVIMPKVLDLNETVESMLKMLRRLIGEDIDLFWRPGAELGPVKVDPAQIDQILANLCLNARDAIDGIGTISIEAKNSVFDEDYCKDHAGYVPGEYVMLAVSDSGCGLNKETQTHLFEPFFTTKEMGKGTGLGLATVYGIVKQNKGFINVYSEPEQGTTFTIYLPRHAGEPEPVQKDSASVPDARGQETILLVEDEAAILKMTAKMLEKQGYTVLAARTPNEAMRLVREHAGEIQLLMTDVIMPDMNGRDLAESLLTLYPRIKCLFMSGYTADIVARRGVLDKGFQFIQKPFSIKELAAKVQGALKEKRGGKTDDTQR